METKSHELEAPGALDRHAPLEEALIGLDPGWIVLGELQIGTPPDDIAADYVLLHPEHGIALVDLAPGRGKDPVDAFHRFLDGEGFARFFPGFLPIVRLVVTADEQAIGDRLHEAFSSMPAATISDPEWAEAVNSLLVAPDQLSDAAPVETHGEPDIAAPQRSEEAPIPIPPFPVPPFPVPHYPAAPLSADPSSRESEHMPEREGLRPRQAGPEVLRDTIYRAPLSARQGDTPRWLKDAVAHRPPERLAHRRRWPVVAVVLAGLTGGAVAWLAMTPVGDQHEPDTVAVAPAPPPSAEIPPETSPNPMPSPGPTPPADAGRTAGGPAPVPPPSQPIPQMKPAAPPPPPAATNPPPAVVETTPPLPPPPATSPPPAIVETTPPPPPPPATSPPPAVVETTPPPPVAAQPAPPSPVTPPPRNDKPAVAPPQPAPPPAPAAASAAPPTTAVDSHPPAPPPAPRQPDVAHSEAAPSAPTKTPPAPPPRQAGQNRPRATAARPAPEAVPPPRQRAAPPAARSRPDAPPIDAADLPPLDAADLPPQLPPPEVSPTPPPSVAPPAGGSSTRPLSLLPRGAAPGGGASESATASGTEAPPPATRAPAGATADASAGNVQEAGASESRVCRIYSATKTVLGKQQPVKGLACRLPDGRWQLVTETPDR